jgi:DNA-binding Lrp family transcriptional regulator
MKEVELKLISELMKNSRRSDRELAKAVGVSQPTISRTIQRLEKEGIIKEYTMIPEFTKIGYSLLTLTFIKHKKDITPKRLAEAERSGLPRAQDENSPETVMAERGIGFGYDAVIIAYEKDYSAYTRLLERIRTFKYLETREIQSFIVDLKDELRFRPFTYSTLANHLLTIRKAKKGP